MRPARSGFTLLEAIASLLILMLIVSGSLTLLRGTLDALARARSSERELLAAERVLVAHLLLADSEIRARSGISLRDGFEVIVTEPQPNLIRIGVRTPSERRELLATVRWIGRP